MQKTTSLEQNLASNDNLNEENQSSDGDYDMVEDLEPDATSYIPTMRGDFSVQ